MARGISDPPGPRSPEAEPPFASQLTLEWQKRSPRRSRTYHLQREEFLPSAYAMIVGFITCILLLLMFTNFEGLAESLVTLGFLSFFFLSLLRLLDIISTPFKVGMERTEDDVSLFLLNELVVQVQAAEAGKVVVADIEQRAEEVEEQLVEVEASEDDPLKAAESATAALADEERLQ